MSTLTQHSLIIPYAVFGGGPARQPGSITLRTLNSLSAIAGQEGEEEEWERDMRGLRSEDEVVYQIHLIMLRRKELIVCDHSMPYLPLTTVTRA